MIEGLKLDFSTEQLQGHLRGKISYHREKARWYASRIADLKSGGVQQPEHGVSNDPVQSLDRSRRSHHERAELFQVMYDHLIPNETYRLSETDLVKLELIGEPWYGHPYR